MKINEAADFAIADAGSPTSHWQARLVLGFANDAGTTRLIERTHCGPLRVQKPLYPEGAQVCHAIVVHPPGGVVGGDALTLVAKAGDAAHAFLTTPGAAKWYKANGRISRQDISLELGACAKLEWLPQETIFFDAAQVALTQSISLADDARYIGCEILCFGRTASGESFNSGTVTQRTSIRRDGHLIWWEQGALSGGSASMFSPLGLSGKTVCATMIAVGKSLPVSLLNAIRQEVAAISGNPDAFGISQSKAVLVARYLGNSSEIARRVMLCVWQHLRPELMACAAVVPRIWNT
ncbi:MAG: urease accessory protein UreD [Glaciimonas sp.]|nr:urease accessory protein UreD [Glaciimonas sp.]